MDDRNMSLGDALALSERVMSNTDGSRCDFHSVRVSPREIRVQSSHFDVRGHNQRARLMLAIAPHIRRLEGQIKTLLRDPMQNLGVDHVGVSAGLHSNQSGMLQLWAKITYADGHNPAAEQCCAWTLRVRETFEDADERAAFVTQLFERYAQVRAPHGPDRTVEQDTDGDDDE